MNDKVIQNGQGGVIIRKAPWIGRFSSRRTTGWGDIPLAGNIIRSICPRARRPRCGRAWCMRAPAREIVPWTQGETPGRPHLAIGAEGVPAGGLYWLETQLRTGNPEALNRGDILPRGRGRRLPHCQAVERRRPLQGPGERSSRNRACMCRNSGNGTWPPP